MKPIRFTIDINGRLKRELETEILQQEMRNTLLERMYPGIRVASVQIPLRINNTRSMTQIEGTLAELEADGTRFCLVGGAASSKDGKLYAVDEAHYEPLVERFQQWPEGLLSYLGILLSECRYGIVECDAARVMVVRDHEFGTNDCRGWISPSLLARFTELRRLQTGRFYQFRSAFGDWQAKGSLKAMGADVAEVLGVDLLIPTSCIKPSPQGKVAPQAGQALVGIREVSSVREVRGSYTLVIHAPADSVEQEIIPRARERVRAVADSLETGDYANLLDLIGVRDEQERVPWELTELPPHIEYTSVEHLPAAGLLKSDGRGNLIRFPAVRRQVETLIAKWAVDVVTAGAVRMPGFALADDGVVFAHAGEVYSASDWLPRDRCLCDGQPGNAYGLVVRYPVRMREDLLPVQVLPTGQTLKHLGKALGGKVPQEKLVDVLVNQLRLKGTLTLHSKTAALNGGDFDYDLVSLIEGKYYSKWVASRYRDPRGGQNKTKKKLSKRRSDITNLRHVAVASTGNPIGMITNVGTQAVAAGREDLSDQLVWELQAALDSLKHGTRANLKLIRQIREMIPPVGWLGLKKAKALSELPERVEPSSAADVVATIYNALRPGIEDMLPAAEELHNFRGLFLQRSVPEEMILECEDLYRRYGTNVGQIFAKRAIQEARFQAAEEAHEKARASEDKKVQAQARSWFYNAKNEWDQYQQVSLQDQWQTVRRDLQVWAGSKTAGRSSWAQALAAVVCRPPVESDEGVERAPATGSILLQTFPQEYCELVRKATGGRAVSVLMPEIPDGEFLVENHEFYLLVRGSDGSVRKHRLFSFTEVGEMWMGEERIAAIREFDPTGPVVVRDGKAYFKARQRPKVRV